MDINITVPIMTFDFQRMFRPAPVEQYTAEKPVHDLYGVSFSISAMADLVNRYRKGQWDSWNGYQLGAMAERLSLDFGFEKLLVLDHLKEKWKTVGVIPYDHQIQTASRVIRNMRGRAILADEVGLGKTIEAGMIIKEYLLRGLARKVLILTPASLCWQWSHEMREKFDIACGLQRSEFDWTTSDILIASLDTAKRAPHSDTIRGIDYDIVVVDEAHKLKNDKTINWRFINSLHKKHCLLLTATPVQNDLKELYNLITLLKPGQLGTFRNFKGRFMEDKRTPKNPHELRELLGRVLVRNRRGNGSVEFTHRRVQTVRVDLSQVERDLYDRVTNFVRNEYQRVRGTTFNILPLIVLQREVCSSSYAAAVTLDKMRTKMDGTFLADNLDQLLLLATSVRQNSKVDRVIQLMRDAGEQFLIFTEYKASQEYIRYRLQQEGFQTLGFDGSLSASRKEWTRELFRHGADVLVCTESGGEGLNFQFCHNVINYDLPWNPMRLEQRIGRVHRLGQTADVNIYNLATADSIEEYILFLLHEKINMFESVIGELDTILSHLRMKRSFESELMDILMGSNGISEIRERLERLGNTILSAQDDVKRDLSIEDLLL